MKLGLIIENVCNGAQEALSINKDVSWSRYTGDVRTPVEGLENFKGSGKTVILAKFLGELGYLLALIKAAQIGSERPNDLMVAWIHIPSACDISNVEVTDVLYYVGNAISAPKGIDENLLYKVFSREYQENSVQISAVSSITSNPYAGYAVRYFNSDYTLKELLGLVIAQHAYSNYKGIFFIDANSGITSKYQKLNFEPKFICSFNPLRTIDGFKPYFKTPEGYVEFRGMIEVPEGEEVAIHWIKQGYAPIKKTFTAKYGNWNCINDAYISQKDYYLKVPRSHFDVRSEDGTAITDFDIIINEKKYEGEPVIIHESIDKQGFTLVIKAQAPGFSEWRQSNVHLSSLNGIVLERILHRYEFQIPAYDGDKNIEKALVILETKRELKDSPIMGYSLDKETIQIGMNGFNPLSYKDDIFTKLKYIGIGFGACVLALLLWAGWEAMDDYEFQFGWPPFVKTATIANVSTPDSNTEVQQPDNQNVEDYTNTESADDVNLVIAYLDKNAIWHKDSLEAYDVTRGMFDELNEFNLQALNNRSEILKDSKKLSDVVAALEKNARDGFDPHKGKEMNQGNYNSATDKRIKVEKYIEWLQYQHPKENANAGAQVAGNAGKITGGNRQKTPGSNITGGQSSTPAKTKSSDNKGGGKKRGGIE